MLPPRQALLRTRDVLCGADLLCSHRMLCRRDVLSGSVLPEEVSCKTLWCTRMLHDPLSSEPTLCAAVLFNTMLRSDHLL